MSNIELNNFIALHRVVNKMDRTVAKIFEANGLTEGQFAVLEALYHKGDMSIGEVQEKILSTSGTIPLIIKNLEKRNLLIRFTDPNDKRRAILQITDEGESLIKEVFPFVKKAIVGMFEPLNAKKKEQLLDLLKEFRRKNE